MVPRQAFFWTSSLFSIVVIPRQETWRLFSYLARFPFKRNVTFLRSQKMLSTVKKMAGDPVRVLHDGFGADGRPAAARSPNTKADTGVLAAKVWIRPEAPVGGLGTNDRFRLTSGREGGAKPMSALRLYVGPKPSERALSWIKAGQRHIGPEPGTG